MAPQDNDPVESESDEPFTDEEEVAPEASDNVLPNEFHAVAPINNVEREYTTLIEAGKIPAARCDICGAWRFLHEIKDFDAFHESHRTFVCTYIGRACNQPSDADKTIAPDETRGSFARWNRKRRRVGPGAYTAPVRCRECGKARLIHPELHPPIGTCIQWGQTCAQPENPDDAREMQAVERGQVYVAEEDVDFAEAIDAEDDGDSKKMRVDRVAVRVTRPLTEPEARSQYPHLDWKGARQTEASKMFGKFQTLLEACEGSSITSPKADFARLLQVYAVKNAETSNPIPRVRIVFGGHNVRDATGAGFFLLVHCRPLLARGNVDDDGA